MSIKLTISGIPVEAETAEEAAALIRELAAIGTPAAPVAPQQSTRVAGPPAPRPIPPRVAARHASNGQLFDAASPALMETAKAFLETVRNGGRDGIAAESLMPIFGVSHVKGLGSKTAKVNQLIKDLGFSNLDAVYTNPRGPNGRIWKPGRRMDEAISALGSIQ